MKRPLTITRALAAMLSCALVAPLSPALAASEPADPVVVPKPVMCTREYRPVCARGPQGVRTYPNLCVARGDQARILYRGACRKQQVR